MKQTFLHVKIYWLLVISEGKKNVNCVWQTSPCVTFSNPRPSIAYMTVTMYIVYPATEYPYWHFKQAIFHKLPCIFAFKTMTLLHKGSKRWHNVAFKCQIIAWIYIGSLSKYSFGLFGYLYAVNARCSDRINRGYWFLNIIYIYLNTIKSTVVGEL